nr:uncharacterized protein LOC114827046 [Malus domestica]
MAKETACILVTRVVASWWVGSFPRKEGMVRKDIMTKNISIHKSQASALENQAAPDCKHTKQQELTRRPNNMPPLRGAVQGKSCPNKFVDFYKEYDTSL